QEVLEDFYCDAMVPRWAFGSDGWSHQLGDGEATTYGLTNVYPFSLRNRICPTPTCTGVAAGMNSGRCPVSRSIVSTVLRQMSKRTPCAIRLSTCLRRSLPDNRRSMQGPNATTSIATLSGS